jgi:thiamine-phosphate pyrophosphorylase
MKHFHRIIDANLSRLGEALRVVEDVLRFEINHAPLVQECKTLRNALKTVSLEFPRMPLVNARSTATDVRANSMVPKRHGLRDVLTANLKRGTEACRSLEETTANQTFSHIRYSLYQLEQGIWAALLRQPLKGPGVYVVSDDPAHIKAMAQKPFVPIVQYRNKHATKTDIYETCRHLADDLRHEDVIFMVNDHVDITIAVDADGVHLGQDDIPTPFVRNQLGETKIIGRTTHDFNQGIAAKEDGADYVSVGPIWETPSKPGRPGIGFQYLEKAQELGIPFIVIGGINLSNINQILTYKPPLIGAIRSTKEVEKLWNLIKKHKK